MASIVRIGSARSSFGNTRPGDQSGGKEVSIQEYYVHSKGWTVIRAKDPEVREKQALCMEMACANNDIGYSQPQRNTLRENVIRYGFDPARTTKPVNCDCSSLVRLCANYAGVPVGDFITSNETKRLMATGEYVKYTDAAHCKSCKRLLRGDILNTNSKGHTVIVLDDGELADLEPEYGKTEYELGERILRNGDEGADVKELQECLIQLGYSCGRYGADGDFGDSTELAVRYFQRDHSCEVDGEYGPESHKAMLVALEDGGEGTTNPKSVAIVGGNCYVRSEPNTKAEKLGVAHEGDRYDFGGEVSVDGWNLIEYEGKDGWVSGKYSDLEE